ncbi:Rv3235 family protein [Streptomyces sp. TRM 70351]|uniref:Rv3235 family protein n=1 Tax=Streptomyces sp. TRM 70351 TaxID=3116552 RepID=UPI002E7B8A05|nr:Rv3235 family protein [Streptomyces sp. TRM 70351]MEE1928068.1 Rv3235 family protein [Streptomyces sp. TRM 70351]
MTATHGTRRPPGRTDARRPSRTALAAARRGARERLPHYWFAHRLLLVLSGLRPVHTLLGHTNDTAYDQLVRIAPLAPLRAAAAGRPAAAPVLLQVGCATPGPGALEAYARIRSGDRTRAFAFRLEQTGSRWRCAAVELDVRPVG